MFRDPMDVQKLRKAPIKIEPKVFFANERTFMAWMSSATFLASASIVILAYADHNPWSQVYGIMLLPVALGFIVYAMVQCKCIGLNLRWCTVATHVKVPAKLF